MYFLFLQLQVFLYNFGTFGARLTSANLAISLLLFIKDKNLLRKLIIPLLMSGPILSIVLVTILMSTSQVLSYFLEITALF